MCDSYQTFMFWLSYMLVFMYLTTLKINNSNNNCHGIVALVYEMMNIRVTIYIIHYDSGHC